jgi:hypothetical protein
LPQRLAEAAGLDSDFNGHEEYSREREAVSRE